MEALKLTYPSVLSGQEFLIDPNPQSIKQKLDSISYVNINKALMDLTQIVSNINRCQLRLNQREENAYLISDRYLIISRHMREQHDRHKAVVNNEQYAALQNLSKEITFSFKRVIERLTRKKMLINKNKRLAKAINHALHYLGIMLIEQYQLYSPIPSYLWRELHLLYQYAEAHKLLDIKTSSHSLNALEASRTIRETYVRSCLMAVINPYHIEDNHHWHLFKYLGEWSKYVQITDNLKTYTKERCFVIDLSSGDKPHFVKNESDYDDEKQVRLLLTHEFLQHIEKHIKNYLDNGSLPKNSFYTGIEAANAKNLMQRVHDFCDEQVERTVDRYNNKTEIDAIWGLNNIHKILSSEYKYSNIQAENYAPIQSTLGNAYNYEIPWQGLNYSEGGICIKNQEQAIKSLRVGDLVMLKKYVNNKVDKSWKFGITRWLNGSEASGATCGLEFIHGEGKLVTYYTKDKDGRQVEHKILVIIPFDRTNTILITPKNLIGEQNVIQTNVDGKEQSMRLIKLAETNSKINIHHVSLTDPLG